MDIDYRGITVEISSITAVTPQKVTPSPRYYHKFHLQKPRYSRGITAIPITVQDCNHWLQILTML